MEFLGLFVISILLLSTCAYSAAIHSSNYYLHAENFLTSPQININERERLALVREDVIHHLTELEINPIDSEKLLHNIEKEPNPEPSSNKQQTVLETDANHPEELETLYYWFTLHDVNSDGALDGNELLHAFSQWSQHENNQQILLGTEPLAAQDQLTPHESEKLLNSMIGMVDNVLREDDINGDGVIQINEFLQSQYY